MIIETDSAEETEAVFKRAREGEFTIYAMAHRGCGPAYVFTVSEPPAQQDLIAAPQCPQHGFGHNERFPGARWQEGGKA